MLYTGVTNFDMAKRCFSRYDFLVGYLTKDLDLFLRHLSSDKPSIPVCSCFGLGKVLANAVYRKDKHTFGAQLEYVDSKNVNFTLGASTKYNDHTFKVKLVAPSNTLALAVKGKCNSTFGYTFSGQLNLAGKQKA